MSILIGFVCCLLAGFLLAVPTARKQPNRFLAAFLLLTAIELSGWLWVTPDNQASWANAFRAALGMLQMPVFLGFFVSSCYSDFRLRWRDALHLLPFGVAVLLTLPGNQIAFSGAQPSAEHYTPFEGDLISAASHIQYYAYMIAVVGLLMQFRSLFREQHSGARSEVLIWLSEFAAVSVFAHTLILVRDLLRFTAADRLILGLQILGALLALAITSWIALKSLLQPQLFRTVDRKLMRVSPGTTKAEDAELERLLAFMDAREPYLDAKLNLAGLSDQVAMTPKEVSELINQSLDLHFFDFVNSYRVKHAQRLLLAAPSRSILEIAYEVGFNSKSSFNSAFKKHAGKTPSAFRNQAQNDQMPRSTFA